MTQPWQRKEVIGGATLYLGDCRAILPSLGVVDAVVTDPPYEFVPMGGGLGAKRKVYKDIYNADLHTGFDPDLLLGVSNSITVFCAKAQIRKLIEWGEANAFRWNLTTFNKTNPTPLCGANYLPDAEYIFHFWKGVRIGGTYADKSRFWVGPASGDSSIHPTVKPVALMTKLVRVASDAPSPTILDPYMGSGTTGMACLKTGARFIGIEVSPDYFEVACERINRIHSQPGLPLANSSSAAQQTSFEALLGAAK